MKDKSNVFKAVSGQETCTERKSETGRKSFDSMDGHGCEVNLRSDFFCFSSITICRINLLVNVIVEREKEH